MISMSKCLRWMVYHHQNEMSLPTQVICAPMLNWQESREESVGSNDTAVVSLADLGSERDILSAEKEQGHIRAKSTRDSQQSTDLGRNPAKNASFTTRWMSTKCGKPPPPLQPMHSPDNTTNPALPLQDPIPSRQEIVAKGIREILLNNTGTCGELRPGCSDF